MDVIYNKSLTTNPKPLIVAGILLLLFGLGSFVLWAFVAPLDQGAYGSGSVRAAGERKSIQTFSGGVVREILVSNGTKVKKGQRLLILDNTQTASQLNILLAQWFSYKAEQARLIAEREDADKVQWPNEFSEYKDDPRLAHEIKMQEQQLLTRKQEFISEHKILEKNLSGLEEQLHGYVSIRDSRVEQIKFLQEQLNSLKILNKKGFIPKLQIVDSERYRAQLNAQLAEDVANIGKTEQSINEVEFKILLAQQTMRKNVEERLSEVSKQVNNLDDKIKSAKFDLLNTVIMSPVSGEVVALDAHTIGGILRAGQRILDIVPDDSGVMISARFSTTLIDKVKNNQKVEIHFPSLDQINIPKLTGRVKTVSADELLDDRTQQSYINAEIEIDPDILNMLRHEDIGVRIGMPVDVLVKTGERTMVNYLMKPFYRRMLNTFKED